MSSALRRYLETKDPFSGPTDPYSSGNGSIMRLAPIPLFYSQDLQQCLHFAGESSRTTHGSQQCVDACRLFAQLLFNAMRASSKAEIFSGLHSSHYCQEVAAIAQGDFLADSYEQMHGSGYVIDSLKSALWCFNQGKDFKDAVLLAANIGNDADTTAAICGQIAGAFYGFSQIPADWRSRITLADDIKQLALGLLAAGQARQGQPA
ncbi:ADP-ribosylation/crystallin J1 [Gallaecimonas xiamenensis 3-C-1]|uniref:ADP-ribosylation/crystallin J1 n=1 Tax=Gallaecimonas xiamenensis 3-C-1 TaxID=745411 RepID=K2J3I8_9GAMM|nr:ADP-ribosylation/crystallin J1 [Gallaecimonas xiamenensis 3-C-1]